MEKTQKSGFGIVGIIIIIAAIAVLGGFFGYQYLKLQKIREEAIMPAAESLTPPPVSTETQPKTDEIDISTWKTYRSEKYGFEVKYPPNFAVREIEYPPTSKVKFDLFISYSSPQLNDLQKEMGPNFGLRITPQSTESSPEYWSQLLKKPVEKIDVGDFDFFFVEGERGNTSKGNLYFLPQPLQKDLWIVFTHSAQEYEKMTSVQRGGVSIEDVLPYETQKQIVIDLLSTFKFIPLEK